MDFNNNYFVTRIKAILPKSLFTGVQEQFDTAFHRAYRQANEARQQNEPEWREMIGRYRHWNCESALREAGSSAGLNVATSHTKPLGGRYSIVYCPEFIIGRAKVTYPTDTLRITKYRAELATLNSFASYKQTSFLESLPTFQDDRLFGLFIAGANRHSPGIPAFVHFSIPSRDLRAWLFSMPIEQLIAAYSEPENVEEVIPDLVKVALKNPRVES